MPWTLPVYGVLFQPSGQSADSTSPNMEGDTHIRKYLYVNVAWSNGTDMHDGGTHGVSSIRRRLPHQTTSSPLSALKRFRCGEVLFLPETHEFPDSDVFTVNADAVLTAVCCWFAVSGGNHRSQGVRRGQKPRTPGGTKPVSCGLAVRPGNRRSQPVRSGQELYTAGGTTVHFGLAVNPIEPQVPHCEEQPRVASSRTDQACELRVGDKPRETAGPTLSGAARSRTQEGPRLKIQSAVHCAASSRHCCEFGPHHFIVRLQSLDAADQFRNVSDSPVVVNVRSGVVHFVVGDPSNQRSGRPFAVSATRGSEATGPFR